MFNIEIIKKREGEYHIYLLGSIDSSTYVEFERKIDLVLSQGAEIIVLHMRDVDYITSNGLGVIFKTKKALEAKGGDLFMIEVQPQVKHVFEIIRALPSMRIFENIEEADAYLLEIQRRDIEKRQNGSR